MKFTIESLLEAAKEKGASDLHITAGAPPKCRVNGNLTDMDFPRLLPVDAERIIKPLIPEFLLPAFEEKGEMDFAYSVSSLGRYRVNVFRQRGSMAAVIRLLGNTIPSVEKLGIPESVVELTRKKGGLVLVTGPAGSGKSTTLASLINIINQNYNVHIITLEDPIEYLHNPGQAIVNQREIGVDTMSYANALRAALREDPDVIVVGEMRDLDTISTAIAAAENGHLVFSTFHTIGAAATIDRIIDVFPPHQQQQIRIQLASVLESIISQQLIPASDGKGRAAAYEVMHTVPAIKNLIREGKTHQIGSILQTNKKAGMQTMDDAIFDLYLQGKIDAEKAISFSQDPVTLERKLF